jgi:FMN reductase
MGRRIDRPAIDAAHSMLARAQGIVIATPLLRGSYSGLLKTFLDVLPFDAFVGKHVLPIVTGRDLRSSALDNALKPVLCAMGAASVLQSLALPEDQIFYEHGGTARLDTPLDERLETAVSALLRPHHSLNSRPNRFSEPPSSFGLTEDTIAVQEFEYGVHTL